VSVESPRGSHLLSEPEAAVLLGDYGITYVAHEVATSAEAAGRAAARVGFPVVLKILSPDVVHKSDVGGVVIGLANTEAVHVAFDAIMAAVRASLPEADLLGALVCRQERGGAEMIVGALRDPTFGPTVMLGAGGVLTEVLGDVVFRLAPLHQGDALDMLRELRAFTMLTGFRGSPPADLDALAATAVRLGDLMCDRPDIAEVDLNPVLASAAGCIALDARIVLAGARPVDEGPGRESDGPTANGDGTR
jgi:acyl-CoA synthetase (NDP forming)